ncbi:PREDICTED: uncharacterized protein LOC106553790 [Thamnophis sirtalis]|uniref:Uncharacterized protein LOC106553790 n=1 Tax=Thamnophis sirtalis TaxID=35019 RepID=A0A6I9YU50_9SAUR|nr:PREDICTED: uncharacterized protein LOC106553790 [Thamnophis sirtalis]
MCVLFSTFPRTGKCHVQTIQLCRRLTVEFLNYVVASRGLRKVFLSIKGIYYQAEVLGQIVTWITPYAFSHNHPTDVDYRVMATFTEFYTTLLGFVNFRLYQTLNLHYPPKIEGHSSLESQPEDGETYALDSESTLEKLSALSTSLARVVAPNIEDEAEVDEFPVEGETAEQEETRKKEEEDLEKQKKLFEGLQFFLNREVPREPLAFVIRCFGGKVSWDKSVCIGATYDVADPSITHQIVDRPNAENQVVGRYYLQPQWVFDSVNAKMRLPVADYFPGVMLPPHLSPFVSEKEGDYMPPEKLKLLALQKGEQPGKQIGGEAKSSRCGCKIEQEEKQEGTAGIAEPVSFQAIVSLTQPWETDLGPKASSFTWRWTILESGALPESPLHKQNRSGEKPRFKEKRRVQSHDSRITFQVTALMTAFTSDFCRKYVSYRSLNPEYLPKPLFIHSSFIGDSRGWIKMEHSQRGEIVLEGTPRISADNSQWTFPASSNIHGLRWEFQVDNKTPGKGRNEWWDLSEDLMTAVQENPTAQTDGRKALPPAPKCCYKSGFVEAQGRSCPRPSLEEAIQQKCYLDKHQRIHSAEQEAEPLEVRKGFCLGDDWTGYLKSHPEEPCERPKGEKDGKNWKAVKRDQGIQTEGRRHRCAQCGKSFRHRQTLAKHQKIHTGEKLHECLACGKSFTSREPLLRHQRIHTGEKPYECAQCGKCFRQRVHLMGHHKTHTGEKPFKCPECGRNFSRRDKLTRHQHIHRGQRSYAHPELGKSFDPKAALLKHQSLYGGQPILPEGFYSPQMPTRIQTSS